MSVVKEWSFAGDIVKGIWLLVNQDKIFEANISSGVGYSIEEWIKECFKLIGKDYKEHVVSNKSFVPAYKTLISDNTIIKSLGYEAEIDFAKLARMMMNL
jgi:GDPmannose 4,6-dehydratase